MGLFKITKGSATKGSAGHRIYVHQQIRFDIEFDLQETFLGMDIE